MSEDEKRDETEVEAHAGLPLTDRHQEPADESERGDDNDVEAHAGLPLTD